MVLMIVKDPRLPSHGICWISSEMISHCRGYSLWRYALSCSTSKGSYWKGKLLVSVCHFCIDLKFLLARICVIENSLISFLLKVLEDDGVVKGSNARIQKVYTQL